MPRPELHPQAEPGTLVRRLSFDLVGLPPSYEQVQTFEADPKLTETYGHLDDEELNQTIGADEDSSRGRRGTAAGRTPICRRPSKCSTSP